MIELEEWLESLPREPVDEAWKARFAAQLRQRQRRLGLIPLAILLLGGLGAKAAYEFWKPLPGELPRQVMELPVRSPVELDGKSQDEILQMRQQAWKGLPELGPIWNPPTPLQERLVWKGIDSKRRWIGIQGQLVATPADYARRFHEGDSMDSVFILNPLLAVGLQSALVSQAQPSSQLPGANQELVPQKITLDGTRQQLQVVYQIPRDSPVRGRMSGSSPTHMLNVINATDLGFTAYSIVAKDSHGFSFEDPGKAYQCSQVYSLNPARHSDEMINQLYVRKAGFMPLRLTSLPAQLTLKLFRVRPTNPKEAPPDLLEIIQVD